MAPCPHGVAYLKSHYICLRLTFPPIRPKTVEDLGDRLDALLSGYERRKQEETRRQVQRAIRMEDHASVARRVYADMP